MTTAYRALSNIEHGEGTDQFGNSLTKTFKYGDLVTHLPTDVMKSLWDAGVLEEVDVPDSVFQDAKKTNAERFGISTEDSSAPATPAPTVQNSQPAADAEGSTPSV